MSALLRSEERAPVPAGSSGASPGPRADGGRPERRTARLPRSRLALNLITLAVTALFTWIALRNIHLGQVAAALGRSDPLWLGPALVAFAAGTAARALRWRVLFAPERRPPLATVANAMMIGYLYNSILPARAGEAARVVVLTQRSKAPAVEIVGTVVLERLYDVVAILVVFFVAEPWLPRVSWFGAAALAAAVLAAAISAAAVVLAIWGDRPLRLLLRPLRRLPLFSGERLERTVTELAHGLSGLRERRVAFGAFVWTTVAWLLTALAAWLVTLALGLHLPFSCGVLVSVAVGLGMILPSPPAAVGVFEGAALIGLSAFGVSHSTALPCALVLHAVNFVPFIVVGALVVHHNARHPARSAQRSPAPALS